MKFRLVEEFTSLEESKKKKRKKPQQYPVFTSIEDLKKWIKERQDGISPFGYINTNAGNVEYNNNAFNHLTGADGGEFGSISGSENILGGGESVSAGDSSSAEGEGTSAVGGGRE